MKDPHGRIIELTCACCGSHTLGRQWRNRDRGFGICPDCAKWIGDKEGVETLQESYGTPGIHHSLEAA